MKKIIIVLLVLGMSCKDKFPEDPIKITPNKYVLEMTLDDAADITDDRWESGGLHFHRYHMSNDLGQELIGCNIHGSTNALLFYRIDGQFVFGSVDSINYGSGVWSYKNGSMLTDQEKRAAKKSFQEAHTLLSRR